VAEEYVKNLRI